MGTKKTSKSLKGSLKLEIDFDKAKHISFKSGYIAPLKNNASYDYVIFLREAVEVEPDEDDDD